jgi:hypothetical protein
MIGLTHLSNQAVDSLEVLSFLNNCIIQYVTLIYIFDIALLKMKMSLWTGSKKVLEVFPCLHCYGLL